MKNTVTTLFLGGNDIAEIPNETTPGISKNQYTLREFKFLDWLNLDGNRIHKIHKNSLPQTLQTLSFSNNLIENFPFDIVFNAPRLQWIYLRGNHIRSIPQIMTFSRKMWLEKLDLSDNYIKRMPEWPFNNSFYIRELSLAINDFQTIPDYSFAELRTGKIILSYNSLRHIDLNAFHGIENNLEYLDLDHNHFREIPEALGQLKKLKYLYLSFNFLASIQNTSFESLCETLKGLSLSNNFFREVPSEALQNCFRITYLNLASNEIGQLKPDNFKTWGENIKSLILSNNRLEQLSRDTFAVLKNLKDLALNFNPLQEIALNIFTDLEHLETLEMSFIYSRNGIDCEILRPLNKLKWLNLDYNNIRELQDTSFETLPDLRIVNLNCNQVPHIPVDLFKAGFHKDLKEIRLYHNKLTEISSHTFDGLNNLETILLTKNYITTIKNFAFNNLEQLNRVFLNKNYLSRIEPYAFNNLSSLKEINLENNFLKEISFESFTNISSQFVLNLSRNILTNCESSHNFVRIKILDMKINKITNLPHCLKHTTALNKLHLDHNFITSIESNGMIHLTSLEELTISHNSVTYVSEQAFVGLKNLQVLNLSGNYIRQLHANLFVNTPRLRIIDLRNNTLSYLPKDIFKNTLLEMLDLSFNSFAVVPSQVIWDISTTLRHLSLGDNSIEHVDIQTFPHTPQLQYLNLRNNKMSLLPDNVFSGLGLLQNLDLSSNPLRTNFKELFHYAQNLLTLDLAFSKMLSAPHFPLPKLLHLNLSHNGLEHISKNSVKELIKLKFLDLSYNNFKQVPSQIWVHLPNLKILDLSNNPIKQLVSDSFQGLINLQKLNIGNLRHLNRFESKSILQLKIIKELTMQSWPNLEHFSDQFCHLLAHSHQLRVFRIELKEDTLDNQFSCNTNRKLKQLEITGKNLKYVQKDALDKFNRNSELELKIYGTQIKELPMGLFSRLHRISYLAIDLSQNLLYHLDPGIFYGNITMTKNLDTTVISGRSFFVSTHYKCRR